MFCKGEQIGNPEKDSLKKFYLDIYRSDSIFACRQHEAKIHKMEKEKTKYLEIRQKAHKRFWANGKAALVRLRETLFEEI